MVFKDSGIAGIEMSFGEAEKILKGMGFSRWTWDYHHATFDFKLEDKEIERDYYLRVRANAVKGRLESSKAVVRFEDPFMGKHILHKGMDYDSEIPPVHVEAARKIVESLKEKLSAQPQHH